MPDYVEFPVDNVVDVHWKKKDPEDPDDPDVFGHPGGGTCGQFRFGTLSGLPIGFSGIYILVTYGLYLQQINSNPYRLPDQPKSFFPMFAEYVSAGLAPGPYPFIWATPGSFTVDSGGGGTVNEYRNINPQLFDGTNASPTNSGSSIEIRSKLANEEYFPIFTVTGAHGINPYPAHAVVQAHCKTTSAGVPPQPAGWDLYPPGFFIWGPTNLGYGSTNDPLTPPSTRRVVGRRDWWWLPPTRP